jgi:glycosyltransferase involved in cell wall biosynthesis
MAISDSTDEMKITAILCTYNRSQSLAKALESVARSEVPDSIHWEVLVVDNNSRDETRSVVEEFCRRDPSRFRYLFEPKQGKSYALNSGCQAASADVLAFMDDDVEVDPHWLYNLTAPVLRGEWAGSGGCIYPERGFVPRRWMDVTGRYGLAPLAMFDLGGEPGELKESPFGTNMAFRKEMFAKHGGFRTDLGPQPGSEIRNEDSEFGSRLLAAGERLWYQPSAIVYHVVPEDRTKREYFQAWWFGKGRGDIREMGVTKKAEWCVAGVPLYLLRRLAVWSLRFAISVHEPERFSSKLKVCWLAGMIREHYEQAHSS